MMDFSKLYQRANLYALQNYLMYGCECLKDSPVKSYSERLADAQKKVTAFFSARYSDIDEYDEIIGYFYEQMVVVEEVYFEIGFILGAKITAQICQRMKQLE